MENETASDAIRSRILSAFFVILVSWALKAWRDPQAIAGPLAAYFAVLFWHYYRVKFPTEAPADPRIKKLGEDGPYEMPCGGIIDPYKYKEGDEYVTCTKGCRHRWEEIHTDEDDKGMESFARVIYSFDRSLWAGLVPAALSLHQWWRDKAEYVWLILALMGAGPFLLLYALPALGMALSKHPKKSPLNEK